MADLFFVRSLPRNCVAGLPKNSARYKFSLVSSQRLGVKGQRRRDGKREGKRRENKEIKKKKENKNIATVHRTCLLFSLLVPLKKVGEEGWILERGPTASLSSIRLGCQGSGLQKPLWKLGLSRPGHEAELIFPPKASWWWVDG